MFKGLIQAGLLACGLFGAAPAGAQVVITQGKALEGGVTPGDGAGFPVTLSVQGGYRLGSNLFPGDNRNGILVQANDVTIDLNGFLISGGSAARPATNSESGVVGLSDRLTVKNGMINAMRVSGIDFKDRPYLIVENMRIINNVDGIRNDNGDFARIQNSTVATNGSTGIVCGQSCQVDQSNVSGNGRDGIEIKSGIILGNLIARNGRIGINILPVAVVGVGNNTIHGNGLHQIKGIYDEMAPNACPGC